jgi:chemotaxis protein CheZ
MDEVVQLAEQVERLRQHIVAALPDDAEANDALAHIKEAATVLDDVADRIMSAADEMKAAVPATADHAEAVNQAYLRLIEACSFHDLTCQRLTKVRRTLETVTDGLGKIRPFVSAGADVPPAPVLVAEPIDADAALLNGPALENEGMSQEEIDKLLEF